MTPSATLHPRNYPSSHPPQNPLPPLLHTPAGLALLELQGAINTSDGAVSEIADAVVRVGRLHFPEHDPGRPEDTAWMRRVYLYVGANQRLTGEVKKLPRPVAIIRRRAEGEDDDAEGDDALEVVDIVKFKIVFSQRPEPVGGEVV